MNIAYRSLILIAAGVLLSVSALAALLICPKCGYENSEGGATCVHCQAELPKEPATDGKESDIQPPSSPDSWHLPPETVEAEIKLARETFDKGEIGVAQLLVRNAMALDALTATGENDDRFKRIQELIRKCETATTTSSGKCQLCGGNGKTTMKVTSLKGEVSYQEVPGRPCPACKGSGKVQRRATIDETKSRLGDAARDYVTLQQGRKFVSVGNSWIPREAEERLSVRQTIELKQRTASPCQECMGTGKSDCRKCKGTGEVKCTNTKCVSGMVTVEEGSLSKTKIPRTEKCKTCNGTGFMPCSECNGMGTALCRKCNGAGERQACSRCGGKGLLSCGKCSGAGLVKEALCASCRGDGAVLCSACNGDGKRN